MSIFMVHNIDSINEVFMRGAEMANNDDFGNKSRVLFPTFLFLIFFFILIKRENCQKFSMSLIISIKL